MAPRLIDFGCLEVYEAKAILITLLAYPDESGSAKGNGLTFTCHSALMRSEQGTKSSRIGPLRHN